MWLTGRRRLPKPRHLKSRPPRGYGISLPLLKSLIETASGKEPADSFRRPSYRSPSRYSLRIKGHNYRPSGDTVGDLESPNVNLRGYTHQGTEVGEGLYIKFLKVSVEAKSIRHGSTKPRTTISCVSISPL